MFAVSETWLNHAIHNEVVRINHISKNREISHGGEVLGHNRFDFSKIDYIEVEYSEQIWNELINGIKYSFGVLYKTKFLEEYEENLCKILLNYKYMINNFSLYYSRMFSCT